MNLIIVGLGGAALITLGLLGSPGNLPAVVCIADTANVATLIITTYGCAVDDNANACVVSDSTAPC